MKLLIWIGAIVGSTLGSFVGGLISNGNFLSGWSLAFGTSGAFVGLWIGYKIGKNYRVTVIKMLAINVAIP